MALSPQSQPVSRLTTLPKVRVKADFLLSLSERLNNVGIAAACLAIIWFPFGKNHLREQHVQQNCGYNYGYTALFSVAGFMGKKK